MVRNASLTLGAGQDVYELDARVDFTLPEDAREGIEAGLTLRVVYEIELARVRGYWPDATIAALAQAYELSYHALSQRYLLRNLNTGEQQDFGYAADCARAAGRRTRPAGHRRRRWSKDDSRYEVVPARRGRPQYDASRSAVAPLLDGRLEYHERVVRMAAPSVTRAFPLP